MAFDPITAGLEFAGKLLDKLIPDPTQRAQATIQLEQMRQTGELAQLTADTDLAKAQISVDQTEATNGNLFVSGWRPAVGWSCAFAFAYHLILQPFLAFTMAAFGHSFPLPDFDTNTLNTTLMGLLGLGAMRSVEKIKGVA